MHTQLSCHNNSLQDAEISAIAQKHISVLLDEVLFFADLHSGAKILDATLGMGGHSLGLLEKAAQAGLTDISLLGLDRDLEALALASKRLSGTPGCVYTRHAPFSEAPAVLDSLEWPSIDFVLADIGVSSLQLDEQERGFSFLHDGPLDMRMDSSSGENAATLVNRLPVPKLVEIISHYGEDPQAGRIARAIDDARSKKYIDSTKELADIIERAYPAKWRATARNHPATRTFQALRMVVNDELGELTTFLSGIVPRLALGGRIAIISFHSLEDRIVKHFFKEQAETCVCPKHVPVCCCNHEPTLRILTKKPVSASSAEAQKNSRATSAKLRVAERV